MQASGEEAAHDEINDWFPAKDVDEEVVEGQDGEEVDAVPDRRLLRADEAWPEGVEEQLERAAPPPLSAVELGNKVDVREEGFPRNIVQ